MSAYIAVATVRLISDELGRYLRATEVKALKGLSVLVAVKSSGLNPLDSASKPDSAELATLMFPAFTNAPMPANSGELPEISASISGAF